MQESTREQFLVEFHAVNDAAMHIIEQQRSQLSLALFVLDELGFDLNDFADAMS